METTEEQQYAQVAACAFTGHRTTRFTFKYDEAHPDCLELKEVLAKQIDFLYRYGVTDFYTRLAKPSYRSWNCIIVSSPLPDRKGNGQTSSGRVIMQCCVGAAKPS